MSRSSRTSRARTAAWRSTTVRRIRRSSPGARSRRPSPSARGPRSSSSTATHGSTRTSRPWSARCRRAPRRPAASRSSAWPAAAATAPWRSRPTGRPRLPGEGACEDGLVNGGAYLIRRGALAGEPDAFPLEDGWLRRAASEGALVACEAEGGFVDIGVPEDYARAQGMFAGRGERVRLAMFDRDGTVNVDTGHLHEFEGCELVASTVDAMRRYSEDPAWRIAVVTNQAGIAKGMYSVDDMRLLHRRMARALRERGVEVDAWYFCPHHPDFTGSCGCRKPEPGMLERAMRDFRVDPAECVMHGDSEKDAEAARRAGVEFVEVENPIECR